MEAQERVIDYYMTEDGKQPFRDWLNSLRDKQAAFTSVRQDNGSSFSYAAAIKVLRTRTLRRLKSIGLNIGGVMVKKKNATYHEDLIESLKDPEEAIGYLKAALEESDMPEVFLVALRNVAESRGMSQLARDSHLNRENLYKMLSKEGNPELGSLYAILNALGFKLSVESKEAS